MNHASAAIQRLMAKVDKTADCWNWTGFKHPIGYGVTSLEGEQMQAHRAAYLLLVGPIPSRMELDHTCHNRACVNPDHLRATTHKQNCENRKGAQRNNSTGVRGVTRIGNRWMAYANHDKRRYSGGRYDTKEEAAAAAVELRNQLFTHNDADRLATTG